MIGSSEQILLR